MLWMKVTHPLTRTLHPSLSGPRRRLKQIKPEYFEESGVLRLLSDKVRRA